MTGIFNWLKGRKTYVVAVAGMLTAFGAWLEGALTTVQLVETLFAGVTVIFVRAGIAKANAKN